MQSRPIVAIAGRTNVGKSTLFNRLVGRRVAIVEDLPGTTRDRLFADISWEGSELTLIDTGGLELKPSSAMAQKVKEQVEVAIAEADLIIFLVDAREGVLPLDGEIADRLRRSAKPILLAANKVDNPKQESQTAEFYQLGIGHPIAISAHHGRGTAELMDKVAALLPKLPSVTVAPEVIKIAILGRPNVGKSMLLNAGVDDSSLLTDNSIQQH